MQTIEEYQKRSLIKLRPARENNTQSSADAENISMFTTLIKSQSVSLHTTNTKPRTIKRDNIKSFIS